MSGINTAYEGLVSHMMKKRARDAFSGTVALLWHTHSPQEVKAMLLEAVSEVDDIL